MTMATCLCRRENYMYTCNLLTFFNYSGAMLKKYNYNMNSVKMQNKLSGTLRLYCNFNLLTY